MARRRSLPRSARLRRSSDIRAMFRSGKRLRCGSLDVYLQVQATNPEGPPRIGVVVPRHGRTIVERNRLRRRLRELLRTGWLIGEWECTVPRDLLVRASAVAYERSFAELRAELHSCLERVS